MDFMDIDDDFDSCAVQDFLNNKLQEMKGENIKMQKIHEELEQETKIFTERENSSKDIIVEKSWTKIVHNKYAIWYILKNQTEKGFKDCRLILTWNSTSPLSYECSMFNIPTELSDFNKSFQSVDVLERTGNIVIVIERPDYLEKLNIEIQGILNCRNSDDKHIYIDIPPVSIEAKDLTDSEKLVPLYKLVELNVPDFVSLLVCSSKMSLIMKISDNTRTIDSLLEIDACLFCLNFAKAPTGRFFLAHKISPVLDGCIMEIVKTEEDGIFKVHIYYRDTENLLGFAHHLYETINSIFLLPNESEILLHSKSREECQDLLRKSISKEIKLAKNFSKKSQSNEEDYKVFKSELCDLEHETDKAYIQLLVSEEGIEDENKKISGNQLQ